MYGTESQMVIEFSLSFVLSAVPVQGRSLDFSKGGSHWVKQYRHGVFATEYCRLFAKKKAYKGGGVTGIPGPP